MGMNGGPESQSVRGQLVRLEGPPTVCQACRLKFQPTHPWPILSEADRPELSRDKWEEEAHGSDLWVTCTPLEGQCPHPCAGTLCGRAAGGGIPLAWPPDLRGLMEPRMAEAERRLLSIRGQVGHRDDTEMELFLQSTDLQEFLMEPDHGVLRTEVAGLPYSIAWTI